MVDKIVISSENVEFQERISKLSDEVITLCDQCGTCSGGCPFVTDMDITPSQIMRMVQLGQEEVLKSFAIWICASCFTCTVRCPRGLDVSKVAEALRQVILRQAADHIELKSLSEDELAKLPQIAIISACRKLTG